MYTEEKKKTLRPLTTPNQRTNNCRIRHYTELHSMESMLIFYQDTNLLKSFKFNSEPMLLLITAEQCLCFSSFCHQHILFREL